MSNNNIKLFICTWNLGNAKPYELEKLINNKNESYDIVAFGLQESTFSNSLNIALSINERKLDTSIIYVKNTLQEILGDEYILVSFYNSYKYLSILFVYSWNIIVVHKCK